MAANVHRSALAFHPDMLRYDFGPGHPLRPERIAASLDLFDSLELWDRHTEMLAPDAAGDADLRRVHERDYISAVQRAGASTASPDEIRRHGLSSADNPAFPFMHESAAAVAGGSVDSVRRIMEGSLDHAFNPAGGLHHALRSRASGFCIYNDPAIAAAVAVEEFDAKVLYLDFDCHHGDGVQWIFYDEPRVMTVSFHESGRFLFPGTGGVEEIGSGRGAGYSVNVPMAPSTQDDSWLEAVHAVVPPLVKRFAPDLIISSHGADTHVWDPLTHLSLTTRSFIDQASLVHRLAHESAGGRWLAVGSGGYDWRRVVPRSWGIVWAEMTGRDLPETLPDSWRIRWAAGIPGSGAFRDDSGINRDSAGARAAAEENRRTLRRVAEVVSLSL